MNRKRKHFHKLLFSASLFLLMTPLSAQQITRELIDREFVALRKLSMEYQARLEFDESPAASSTSQRMGRKIIVNIPQLQRITASVGNAYAKDVVRLLLAHELGHQLQYTHAGERPVTVVNECQADILAGYLITQRYYSEIPTLTGDRQQAEIDRLKDVTIAIYSSMYLLGNEFDPGNKHPRSDQRKVALRDGISYAYLWMYEMVKNTPSNPLYADPNTTKAIRKIKENLNYIPGDNVITWSLRHAKRIIHVNADYCKELIFQSTHKWQTSVAAPYVFYEQQITNPGNKTVTITYYNQVYTSLKKDPANPFHWNIISTGAHTKTIYPGTTVTVKGQLEWYANDSIQPSFLSPARTGALYTCSCLENKAAAAETYSLGNVDLAADNNTTPRLSTIVDQVISDKGNFDTYIDGIGILHNPGSDRINFDSKRKLPGAIFNYVIYSRNDKKYMLEAAFYSGKNRQQARQVLNKLITDLSADGLRLSAGHDDRQHQTWEMIQNSEVVGRLRWMIFDTTNLITTEFYN